MAAVAAGYIRLNYHSGATVVYVDLKIKAAHGLDDPERNAMWPPIKNTYLDGNLDTQFYAYRRKPFIDLGVISSRDNRIAFLMWFGDNNRTIDYNNAGYHEEGLSIVPSDMEYEFEWKNGVSFGRAIIIYMEESSVRKFTDGWPAVA